MVRLCVGEYGPKLIIINFATMIKFLCRNPYFSFAVKKTPYCKNSLTQKYLGSNTTQTRTISKRHIGSWLRSTTQTRTQTKLPSKYFWKWSCNECLIIGPMRPCQMKTSGDSTTTRTWVHRAKGHMVSTRILLMSSRMMSTETKAEFIMKHTRQVRPGEEEAKTYQEKSL